MLDTSADQRRLTSCVDAGVHERIAEYAASTPWAIAVRSGETELTYRQLDSMAADLAVRLHAAGVRRDRTVGVLLDRSAEFVVAVLAVLRAGGCYVPLDPGCPDGLLDSMIRAADLSLAVTRAELRPRLDGRPVTLLLADEGDGGGARGSARRGVLRTVSTHPFDLACVLFTPDPPAAPHAVAVRHCGLTRLVSDPACARLDQSQILAACAEPWDGASLLEIWGVLANGGTAALAPAGPLTAPRLARFLRDEHATCAVVTADLFDDLVATCLDGLGGLEQLVVTDGSMKPRSASRFLRAHPRCRLVNGYGPTEVTTFAVCRTVTARDARGPRIPIGRPTSGTSVEILDEDLAPVPPGTPGRLYAGGTGLARGYLRDAGLTAERFVPDPWGRSDRLYATGDLALYRPDGAIDLLGPAGLPSDQARPDRARP